MQHGFLKLATLVGGAVLLAGVLTVGGVYRYLHTPLPIREPVTIMVEPGTALDRVAESLAEQQQLRWPIVFSGWARLSGAQRRIHAGEYRLDPQTTPYSLLRKLTEGDVLRHTITFVEGWTMNRVLQTLWREERIDNTLQSLPADEVLERIDSPFEALEGSIFPDTYAYTRGTTDAAILRRATERLQRILTRHWQQRATDLPYESPWQALIMASIIEKESGLNAEKSRIAGVFVRRLRRGMRLQSDPTVIYGMGGDYGGTLRRSDLRADTAYNTYRRNGLPPTPIALSGEASIRASLNPQPGSALYFVSRGDGSHQFSATLKEHNDAVQRYLRNDDDGQD